MKPVLVANREGAVNALRMAFAVMHQEPPGDSILENMVDVVLAAAYPEVLVATDVGVVMDFADYQDGEMFDDIVMNREAPCRQVSVMGRIVALLKEAKPCIGEPEPVCIERRDRSRGRE